MTIPQKYLLIALGGMTLLSSCKDQPQVREEVEEQEIIKTEEVEEKAPAPIHTYTKDSVSIKAYDYAGLKQFLEYRNDTTYVVNFWATWCEPCVEELPHFEKLNEKYKKNKIKVLLVSLDMHKQVEDKLIPFIKGKQIKSDVVLLRDPDSNAWITKIDSVWTGAIPATLIYNKDMRKFYEKSFTYESLEKEVSNFK